MCEKVCGNSRYRLFYFNSVIWSVEISFLTEPFQFWKRITRSMNHLTYEDVNLSALVAAQSWMNSPWLQVSEVNRVEQGVIKSQNVWDLHFHDCLSGTSRLQSVSFLVTISCQLQYYSTNDGHYDVANRGVIVGQFLLLFMIISLG